MLQQVTLAASSEKPNHPFQKVKKRGWTTLKMFVIMSDQYFLRSYWAIYWYNGLSLQQSGNSLLKYLIERYRRHLLPKWTAARKVILFFILVQNIIIDRNTRVTSSTRFTSFGLSSDLPIGRDRYTSLAGPAPNLGRYIESMRENRVISIKLAWVRLAFFSLQ